MSSLPDRSCSVSQCSGEYYGRGLCKSHYMHARRNPDGEIKFGDYLPRPTAEEQRLSKNAYMKKYYEENTEAVQARNNEYHRTHNPEIRLTQKRYRNENKTAIRAAIKAWNKANPDKYAALNRRSKSARRARENSVEFEYFTVEDVITRWGTDCHICGSPIDMDAPRYIGSIGWELGLHLDHVIPISKQGPHTLANVKPSHGRCNLIKGSTLQE